jgi:hypothetical protein
MKSMKLFAIALGSLFIALSGCTKDEFAPAPLAADGFSAIGFRTADDEEIEYCGDTTEVDLIAGQHILAGKVIIGNDADSLYVTIITEEPWLLRQTHLHVSTRLGAIPTNKQGIPVPGRFAHKTAHDPMVTSFTYAVELTWEAGQELFIALHAEVVQLDDEGSVLEEETAWGGDLPGSGPRWWFYLAYTVQDCVDDDSNGQICYGEGETAWADGPRFTQQGNWGTYTPYSGAAQSVTIYAGQTLNAGTAEFSAPDDEDMVTITITLGDDWRFQPVDENIKIQDYSAIPLMSNPNPGQFTHKRTADASPYVLKVPNNSYYGIHLDVQQIVPCP